MTLSDGFPVSKVLPALTDCAGAVVHEWAPPSLDSRRRCVVCGVPGRGDAEKREPGFFQDFTAARAELFSNLKAPASVWGSAKK